MVSQRAQRLTESHRLTQRGVGLAAAAGVIRAWQWTEPVDGTEASMAAWLDTSATIIEGLYAASALKAARFASDYRSVEVGQATPQSLDEPPTLDRRRVRGVLAATGPINYTRALNKGDRPEIAARKASAAAGRSAMRLAMSGGREHLLNVVHHDRAAVAWERVVAADPCAFCAVIALGGPIQGGRFQAHDSCLCTIRPVYDLTDWRPPAHVEKLREIYDDAVQGVPSPEALNAFRRALTAQRNTRANNRTGNVNKATRPPTSPKSGRASQDPFDAEATTATATAYMRNMWPRTTFDVDPSWPAEVMVPNLRQLDRCGRDYPNMMDGLIIRTYNEIPPTKPHLKDAFAWYGHNYKEGPTIGLGPSFKDPKQFAQTLRQLTTPYSADEMRELAAEGEAKLGPGYATTWLQRGGDDITSVITHEFGHRVDYVQDDRIRRWVLDVERVRPRGREPVIHPDIDGLSESAKRGYFDQLRNHLNAQLIDDATHISIYAQTNGKEAFAEAFAARYHHPDRANLVSNATLDAYGRLARRELNIGYGSKRDGQDEYLSATGLSKRRVDIRNRRLAVSVYRQLGIRKIL